MEDDEEEQHQPSTPFWLQNTKFRSSRDRRLGTHIIANISSIIFNSTSVILLLLVAAALIFIFFIIPSILNFTSQVFRPNSVKRSWDSLNLVLVLFAIICAFLGRTNNNEKLNSPTYNKERELRSSEYSERSYSSSGLRSSSSYPDLRQQEYSVDQKSPWVYADYNTSVNNPVGKTYRFLDDSQIKSYQFSDTDGQISSRQRQPMLGKEVPKEIKDDKVVANPPPPPPVLSQPLPEMQTRTRRKSYGAPETLDENQETLNRPPSTAVKRKAKRVHRSFDDADQSQKPPSPLPTESDLSEKKRSGGTTKDIFSSFYSSNQKRKKKTERRHRSLENLDPILNPPAPSLSSSSPPPPPPSVFHNLFSSKKGKRRKPGADPLFTKPNSTIIALSQPQFPTKLNMSNQQRLRGNESPLYGIPEPPPLPPFGMPVWKFVVEGDYARIKSMNSSRSGSPDLDDTIRASSERSDLDEEEVSSPSSPAMFAPSPDVNTKADNFIARFRAGLKIEKVNSGKGLGLSRLGPNSDECLF